MDIVCPLFDTHQFWLRNNVAKVKRNLMQLSSFIPVVEAWLKQGHYVLSLKASHLFWRKAVSDVYTRELVSEKKMAENHCVRG